MPTSMFTEATETAATSAAETKKTLKPHYSEKWEIDAIGRFLLDLHHKQVITQRNGLNVMKGRLRSEFGKFLNAAQNSTLREKFIECNGTADVGTLLYRTNYLINTPRGCNYYRIDNRSLYKYRNQRLEECDEKQKNGKNDNLTTNTLTTVDGGNKGDIDFQEDVVLAVQYEVDENAESHAVAYQATDAQNRDKHFHLTSMGCYICQRNFATIDAFEEHMEFHSGDSNFKYIKNLNKCSASILKISYQLCKNSHYFCFTLESMRNVVIEKIMIVQSRSMYYVHNSRVPYELPIVSKDTFFVDSHLFAIHLEQPIVVVLHEKQRPNMRIVEEHHFMRNEPFPMVHIAINPYHLPNHRIFKPKLHLPQYLPTKEMRTALKNDAAEAQFIDMCNEFKDYLNNNKKLTIQNIRPVLNILLQIEDMDSLREYFCLIQHKVELRQLDKECTVKLQTTGGKIVENVLSPYDEVIIIADDEESIQLQDDAGVDLLLKNTDDLIIKNKKQPRKKPTHFGIVESVFNGRVTFVSNSKITTAKTYTLIFRPARMTLRYQYRALELFSTMCADDIKRCLFPEVRMPRPMPLSKLLIHNHNITGNAEQLQAVNNIASNPHLDTTYIIFGPPGTGKTTTLVEAILQLYLRHPTTKILVTAGSNSACDEVALRLCKVLSPMDESRAITRIYSRSNERRMDNIDEMLLDYSNMYSTHFYPDVEVLHEFRIIVCTMSVVGKLATGKFGKTAQGHGIFTHVFIDEVAASTEAEALMCLTSMITPKTSLIISGDHKQLGPILHSTRAEELGLGVSLMERLLARDCYRVEPDGSYDRSIQTRLCRNFRSHPEIVKLYNSLYYNNELIANPVGDVTSLCEQWHHSPSAYYPIIFHSVFGTATYERKSTSMCNPLEVLVVMDYVKDLMYFGVNGRKIKQEDIGIISPYKKQYLRIQDELNARCWFGIETGSVETFQGKEKPIIIVSFVRSFSSSIGFLKNPRRLNVTLSRAKSLLILVGNPKTLSTNADYKTIIESCRFNNTLVGSALYDDEENDNATQRTKNVKQSMESLTLSTETLNENNSNNAKANAANNPRKNFYPKKNKNINNENQSNTPAKVNIQPAQQAKSQPKKIQKKNARKVQQKRQEQTNNAELPRRAHDPNPNQTATNNFNNLSTTAAAHLQFGPNARDAAAQRANSMSQQQQQQAFAQLWRSSTPTVPLDARPPATHITINAAHYQNEAQRATTTQASSSATLFNTAPQRSLNFDTYHRQQQQQQQQHRSATERKNKCIIA